MNSLSTIAFIIGSLLREVRMEHQIVNRSNCVSSFFQVLSLNEARLNVNQA